MIGSGYIGLETAGFINGFGFKTEVLFRSWVLRSFDNDMSDKIVKYMSNEGVKFTNGFPISFH